MSELAEKLDLSRYVPQNYPDLIAYKQCVGCPEPCYRCPETPCYTKNFFCSEWGDSFKCICPQDRFFPSPYRGVRKELDSLDFFTRLPDNPHIRRPYPQEPDSLKFRTYAQRYGIDEINDCPLVCPNWSRICPENQKVFNLIHKDGICGLCVPPERAKCLPEEPSPDCSDYPCQTWEDIYDLPFRVKVGTWPPDMEKKPYVRKTGVSYCLHPSDLRDLQSVHRDSFRNFYKLKTPEELRCYQSPLAIDTSRPKLKIPTNDNEDKVLCGTQCVRGCLKSMGPKEPRKLPFDCRPKYEVIVQGPICI